jgi:methylenetetrahydrofolate reductase (NADPH)
MTSKSKALPSLSFEFFPPHTPEASLRLWRSVERLAPLAPQFVSVTYGAGGTTRDRTNAAIMTILGRARLNVAGHLTCVGASREETLEVARGYARMGLRRIVALRGDPPKGETRFTPHPDGFRNGAELVAGLRQVGDFEIAVAAYPEKHPEAADLSADIDNLKRKLDAGASKAITQYAFDTDGVLRFIDRARAAGITAPIIPGIMPVSNFKGLVRFSERCGAKVPDWMHRVFAGLDNEPATRAMVATAVATEQCRRFAEAGLTELHFYTLNRADVTRSVCRALGVSETAAG